MIRRRAIFRPSRKLRRDLRPVYRAWKHYKRASTLGARDMWLYKLSHAVERHLARRRVEVKRHRARAGAALHDLLRLIAAAPPSKIPLLKNGRIDP